MTRLLLLAALTASVAVLPIPAADAATGEPGAQLAESTFVGAMTAGPDGDVWFSAEDYGSERPQVVGEVNPAGEVDEYTVPDGANSITTGADGNVWFTEADAIGRITTGGDATSFELAPGTGVPQALTTGPDGNVWFVTDKPAAVGRISASGSVTMFPLSGEGQPSAITSGPAGDLWFTEPGAGRIGRITIAGEESEFQLLESARPNSIVLGPDGNLWFSDISQPRVGRISPTGKVTFFPVPTIESTDEVTVGPHGLIWFTARDEIGTISTAGKVSWPSCFSPECQYPPAAMTTGPDGSLWVASGSGHCPSYCGGGSGQAYIFGNSSIGHYDLPAVKVGIGPRLAPLRHRHTSIVVGCGDHGACSGTLRLRALVELPGAPFSTRLISKLAYRLAAGEIREIPLRLPLSRWNTLRYSRHFLVVDAIQDGSRVAKRGFHFSPDQGGIAKHF